MRHVIYYNRPFYFARPFHSIAFFHGRANGAGVFAIVAFLVAMIIFFGVIWGLNRSGEKK